MITIHTAAQRAMRQALDEAMEEFAAAFDDPDETRFAEKLHRVFQLERQLDVLDWGAAT